MFFKSTYWCSIKCGCLRRFNIWLYPFLQWLSLMYHDKNTYLKQVTCEYCGEDFSMFEKLVFPNNCTRNPLCKNQTVKTPTHLSQELLLDPLSSSASHLGNAFNRR